MKSVKLTVIALGIGIIFSLMSLSKTHTYLDLERRSKIFATYSDLDCEQMKTQFEIDLQNDELKYFSGGFVYNEKLGKELRKLGIEEFYQGCVIRISDRCYRDLLLEYLKKEKNVDLETFWK